MARNFNRPGPIHCCGVFCLSIDLQLQRGRDACQCIIGNRGVFKGLGIEHDPPRFARLDRYRIALGIGLLIGQQHSCLIVCLSIRRGANGHRSG